MNKLIKMLCCCTCLAAMAAGCTSVPQNVKHAGKFPPIFPDYIGVTIPADIAPLNFNYKGLTPDCMDVTVKGSKGGELHANGAYAAFDTDEWHRLTAANRGGFLTFTVCVEEHGQWIQYKDFTVNVSTHELGEWGITYRRIAPGYEVYGKMGLYQRHLATFNEYAILENTAVPGACVNCHTPNRTDPATFTFHVRGAHGATLIQRAGQREWLKARNDSIGGTMVYPYWHPGGRYCAYSTNQTHQSFHAVRDKRIEVFDQASDVFVYDASSRELILDTLLMTKDHYETYPVFSPDGRTLYFCSSEAYPIPAAFKDIRYNICKISFDPSSGKFGARVDTLFNARRLGKSAAHPRPSYDGRFLLFTMSDYGCFPIWHKEADNWMLDLRTGKAWPLEAANSSDTDSWHNWSTNSRWIVFASRRDGGLYTRLYMAAVDGSGHAGKPFLLPQKNPAEYYEALFDSYNTPDFTKAKVEFDARSAGDEIMSGRRVETRVR